MLGQTGALLVRLKRLAVWELAASELNQEPLCDANLIVGKVAIITSGRWDNLAKHRCGNTRLSHPLISPHLLIYQLNPLECNILAEYKQHNNTYCTLALIS
jgi:hypothetical protein